MRALLVGPERERDRVRWQLEGSPITIVGEFSSVADAGASGIEADVFVMAASAVGERGGRRSMAPEASDVEPLTPREIEVLGLLAEGLPNKAIARRLGISDQTVKFHVAALSGKLGASNRTDAVRRGLRRGLITI